MRSTKNKRMPLPIDILLLSALLMNAGLFMIIPFLTIYLTTTLHYAPWQVGTVLSINLLCSRLLPLVTGVLGDRTRHSINIIVGIAVRGIGFLGYVSFHEFIPLVAASFLTGVGTALYMPSVKAVFAAQSDLWRARAFMRLNQALNFGAMIGPLLGSFLVTVGVVLPFLCGGVLLLCLAGTLFLFRHHYATSRTQSKATESFRRILQHKPFVSFVLTMILFYIIFTQLTVSLPIQVLHTTHQSSAVGTLFMVNGLAGVLLMFLLNKVFQKYPSIKVVSAGMLCTGLGLALIPFFPALIGLSFCVIIYTLGETLVLPGSDMVTAQFSSREHSGAFYGMFSLAWAIGGTIGNYLGPWLMSQNNGMVPWLIYGALGGVACLLLLFWTERLNGPNTNLRSQGPFSKREPQSQSRISQMQVRGPVVQSCPSCQVHLPSHAHYCGNCGYPLTPTVCIRGIRGKKKTLPAQGGSLPEVQLSRNEQSCPSCQAHLPSHAHYCGHCGTVLSTPSLIIKAAHEEQTLGPRV